MKPKRLIHILVFLLLVACSNEVVPTTTIGAVQPTETSIAVATPVATLTLALAATTAPTMIPTISPDLGLLSWEETAGMEPTSSPLTEWCGMPVMGTALAGDIMDQTSYVYKTSSPPMDIYKFYLAEMPKLGWELYMVGTNAVDANLVEAANLEEFHPSLFYQKDSFSQGGNITMLGDFQNNLIYIMIACD
jgi:hypothetical protein